MRTSKERKKIRDAKVEILRRLVNSEGPLNRYQLEYERGPDGRRRERKPRIRRETIYNVIAQCKQRGEISIVDTKATRTGQKSDRYILTDRGLYSAAMLNPDLEDNVASRLGNMFRVMQENVKLNQMNSLEEWAKMARTILSSGKALPNSSIGVEIYANARGQVRYRQWFDPWGLRIKKEKDKPDSQV
jgi:hypothetical protein